MGQAPSKKVIYDDMAWLKAKTKNIPPKKSSSQIEEESKLMPLNETKKFWNSICACLKLPSYEYLSEWITI